MLDFGATLFKGRPHGKVSMTDRAGQARHHHTACRWLEQHPAALVHDAWSEAGLKH